MKHAPKTRQTAWSLKNNPVGGPHGERHALLELCAHLEVEVRLLKGELVNTRYGVLTPFEAQERGLTPEGAPSE